MSVIAGEVGAPVAVYDYRDERGELIFQVVRYEPKTFRQRRPDGGGGWVWGLGDCRRVLYRLAAIVKADPSEWIFLCEGERDADLLMDIGLLATTCPGGANGWRPEFAEMLRGRHVVLVPDQDAPGKKHGERCAQGLHGIAAEVRVLNVPTGNDVSEWFERSGLTAAEARGALLALADATPVWTPDDEGPQPDSLWFSEVKAEPVRWLWPGRIPLGKLTLFAGLAGFGKSVLSLDIASRLSRGVGWPDGAPPSESAVSVILSNEDDPTDTIAPRLQAAGADFERMRLLRGWRMPGDKKTFPILLPQNVEVLRRELAALQAAGRPARLVVLDAISGFLGRCDGHGNVETRMALSPLVELAQRFGCAILTITHLRKSPTATALHRVIGSVAFGALARSVWLLTPSPDDPERRLLLPLKANLAAEAQGMAFAVVGVDLPGIGNIPRLLWQSEPVTETADDMLAALDGGSDGRSAVGEAADWLRDLLAEGPVLISDIRREGEGAGHSWATIRRAKDRLKIVFEREGFGRGAKCFWKLPPGIVAQSPSAETRLSNYDGDGQVWAGDRKKGDFAGPSDPGSTIPAQREMLSNYDAAGRPVGPQDDLDRAVVGGLQAERAVEGMRDADAPLPEGVGAET